MEVNESYVAMLVSYGKFGVDGWIVVAAAGLDAVLYFIGKSESRNRDRRNRD